MKRHEIVLLRFKLFPLLAFFCASKINEESFERELIVCDVETHLAYTLCSTVRLKGASMKIGKVTNKTACYK